MKPISQLLQFKAVQNGLFFGLLIFATLIFLWLVQDFIAPVFWAVVFGIVFYPLFRKWQRVLRWKWAASVLTILTILIVVFVPLYFIGSLVVKESITFAQYLSAHQDELVTQANLLISYIPDVGVSQEALVEKLTGFAETAVNWLSGQALAIGQGTFSFVVKFLLMLYVLFFIFRDGSRLGETLMRVLPLGDDRERELYRRFCSITRAIFKGTLVIALIQGAIGGTLFWIAGTEGVVLWAVVMAILSVIPAIGPGIIWMPAGLFLLFTGDVFGGLVLLIGGFFVLSTIDNLLRPILVGHDTKMPDVLILLSTLGGLSLFGIAGFIVGPVIAGFFLAMWAMFAHDYEHELETLG
ncbi:AI-2E family transporter [Candidatus Kaiserbacteria bacterium CG10_big_fil_rev_8_21_14_0_10_49_17]|uniref:AI-2E family transporter n=1 Tax=Candidatus Kaiserbacteria bacterium CG10_big_fil_rev_8_21_14_0_10_49_17 TaxID=1974609 RepID=A0A2M6WEG4_9BACT|nr:MAG: AI-2E family transporter [Candidatus Kaiserbacteria bacterium CG10_big_fil_rev_8_21_14_0_10_49_17]